MKRRLPSRCHAGCPTETSSPHSTFHGGPDATNRDAPAAGSTETSSGVTTNADRSHGMSGWSHTAMATRRAVGSSRGAP
jgi:hypothetical protein